MPASIRVSLFIPHIMNCEGFVFQLPSGLQFAANRYTPANRHPNSAACSFLFAHCTSAHKEQWEITIEKLFNLASNDIHEAWAVDCQSHGASAVLNADMLTSHTLIGIEEYAFLLHWFIEHGPIRGDSCVAVGHSSSTSAWVLACTLSPSVPLRALVLIEPVMISFPDHQDLIDLGKARVKFVAERRDKWKDNEELSSWMNRRHPWKTWDPRILEIHLASRHGFRKISLDGREMLTPKCPTIQESRLYTHEPHVLAGQELHKICSRIPVHVLFAESADFVSPKARSATCDASAGRVMASISIIPHTGHLAVQEQPESHRCLDFQCRLRESPSLKIFPGAENFRISLRYFQPMEMA
ncbi:Alpha/beta-hydrolase [Mycena venus]|uniref:Alpha/beta-hydrolase n=1 Tax=Mycena venus TaxID=2733690 RepID=A0A8H6WYB6_9AGAR|nr:Alpha/beta-hydrolase [Mycena venus]